MPISAYAVIVHVQPCLLASGAEGRPIAVRITDALLVRGVVGDLFGDEGAAFLSGRPQPKKACLGVGRRESILAHETRSSVLGRTLKVSHLLLQFRQLTPRF